MTFLDQLVAKGKAVRKANGAYELTDAKALAEEPIIKIMHIVGLAYKVAHGIPEDWIFEQAQVETVLMTWMRWTRSVGENDPRFRDGSSPFQAQGHDWWMPKAISSGANKVARKRNCAVKTIINADTSVNEPGHARSPIGSGRISAYPRKVETGFRPRIRVNQTMTKRPIADVCFR